MQIQMSSIMAAMRADVFLFALFLYCAIFTVKNVSYVTGDGISITLNYQEENLNASFGISYLHASRKRNNFTRANHKALLTLLLILSGDIETCPGPSNPELKNILNGKGIHLFHQNIRGLFSKKGLIEEFLNRSKDIDILTLSETHIDPTENNDLYKINGFSFENKPRNSGKGGGVSVYVSDNIKFKRRKDLEDHAVEWLWLEITPKNSKGFLVCCIYRPPDSSKFLPKDFEKKLSNILSKISNLSRECIILGDVNVNFLSNNNKEFKQTFLLYGFKLELSLLSLC